MFFIPTMLISAIAGLVLLCAKFSFGVLQSLAFGFFSESVLN